MKHSTGIVFPAKQHDWTASSLPFCPSLKRPQEELWTCRRPLLPQALPLSKITWLSRVIFSPPWMLSASPQCINKLLLTKHSKTYAIQSDCDSNTVKIINSLDNCQCGLDKVKIDKRNFIDIKAQIWLHISRKAEQGIKRTRGVPKWCPEQG